MSNDNENTGEAHFKDVREALTGNQIVLETPFGKRPIVYADYTASGRASHQVEAHISRLNAMYANPHTQDSATGRASSDWLRQAERTIKRSVNAGPDDHVICCGSGATGAVHKLQEILGVGIPPASRDFIRSALAPTLGPRGGEVVEASLRAASPVIFIGPYEHHSNELSWRESSAEIVQIGLSEDGQIDLLHLQRELCNPLYTGRIRIGAFSAASNVTGIKTDVNKLSRILHSHDAILVLDCAASAPYLPIDMHPQDAPDSALDAVYFSPHKFVGGPGSCGVLVFNDRLYRDDLPPTQCAGGTVRYVWKHGHDFIEDVEARESAGTPGVPQIVRAALAMKLQAEVGLDAIAAREHWALNKAFSAWKPNAAIKILGPADADKQIGIVSFNVSDPRGQDLHPRFVTTLLSDLFGIQSRAGCSCAGPYGHDLLDIDDTMTLDIRDAVLDGNAGLRPGWCRVSLHWVMSDAEIEYLIDAVEFIARDGWLFLQNYNFDPVTGMWDSCEKRPPETCCFPSQILDDPGTQPVREDKDRGALFRHALEQAERLAARLGQNQTPGSGVLDEALEPVRYFTLP
jgi:selenocysteine lyase/cysteine desulfurase